VTDRFMLYLWCCPLGVMIVLCLAITIFVGDPRPPVDVDTWHSSWPCRGPVANEYEVRLGPGRWCAHIAVYHSCVNGRPMVYGEMRPDGVSGKEGCAPTCPSGMMPLVGAPGISHVMTLDAELRPVTRLCGYLRTP
jgi:hypothetical protein